MAWMLTLSSFVALCGTDAFCEVPPVRYVTRFETQQRVTYEPQVQYIEKTVTRPSWNPFQRQQTVERKMVPVVRWIARTFEEKLPVTERQAVRTPNRGSLAQRSVEGSWSEDLRAASTNDGWRPKRSLAVSREGKDRPEPSIAKTPDFPQSKKSWRRMENPSRYGGVQRFDEDNPRVGMQLRELR